MTLGETLDQTAHGYAAASGITGMADALPDTPGAYLLLIDIGAPPALPQRFAGLTLGAGRYGYAGSAYGPGGIRARCRRNLSRPLKRRWHIDWLTSSAAAIRVIAFPGGSECRLVDTLSARSRIDFPIPRFGSSDCRSCPTHLVRFANPQCLDDGAIGDLLAGERSLLG